MPKGSKAASLEKKLKAKGMPDSEVYAIENKKGLMHGNKVTTRGRQKSSGKK